MPKRSEQAPINPLLRILPWALLLAALITAPMAYFLPADLANCDLQFYSTAYRLFSEQFWAGDLYPRWLNATNSGLGSPTFIFYNPFAAYLYTFTSLLPLDDRYGMLRFYATAFIIFTGVFASYYLWVRGRFGHRIGFRAMLLYAGCGYLLVILYNAAALSVLSSFIWMHVSLLLIDRLRERPSARLTATLAIVTGLLLLSHLPTAECFLPFSWLYAAHFSGIRRQPVLWCVMLAQALGGGLSAFYWYPLMLNAPFMDTASFVSGNLSYRNNFFHPYVVFFAPYLLLMAAISVFLVRRRLPERYRWTVRRWGLIFAGVLLLTTPLSLPLWDLVKPLQKLQFPSRFYAVLLPGFGLLMAIMCRFIPTRFALLTLYGFALGFVALPLAENQFTLNARSQEQLTLKEHNAIVCFYGTTATTKWMPAGESTEQMLLHTPELSEAAFEEGNGAVLSSSTGAALRDITLKVNSESARLLLKNLYFPGIEITDQTTGKAVEPSPAADGRVRISLSHGEHALQLRHHVLGQHTSGIISLAFLIMIGYIAIRYRPTHRSAA